MKNKENFHGQANLCLKEIKPQFKLPGDDMAFRQIYSNFLKNESLKTVFRPGQRGCGVFRGYCPGDIVKAQIIVEPGLDRAQIPPIFLEKPLKMIRIESIFVKELASLSSTDFQGSSPDVQNKRDLIYHLGLIYNLDFNFFNPRSLITRIHFSYIH